MEQHYTRIPLNTIELPFGCSWPRAEELAGYANSKYYSVNFARCMELKENEYIPQLIFTGHGKSLEQAKEDMGKLQRRMMRRLIKYVQEKDPYGIYKEIICVIRDVFIGNSLDDHFYEVQCGFLIICEII